MKLDRAIEMGEVCGLQTTEECVRNVYYHCMSLFPFNKVQEEMEELYDEFDKWEAGELKLDIPAIRAKANKELEEYFDSQTEGEDSEGFSFPPDQWRG